MHSDHLRAIVEAIVPSEMLEMPANDRRMALEAAAEFTQCQIGALSTTLRFKAQMGLLAFLAYARIRRGVAFRALSLHDRRRLVDSWSYGSLHRPRQLFRLLRSVALLAYFEHPAIARRLHGADGRETARERDLARR